VLREAAIRTLISEIRYDLDSLDEIVEEMSQAFRLSQDRQLSSIEIRGCASLIHDFYTCLESIFQRIAAEINSNYPSGSNFHRRLIRSMAMDVEGVRPAVISPELLEELDELRKFRHFIRHAYGVTLKWDKVKRHIIRISRIYHQLRQQVEEFTGFLSDLAGSLS
jgi:hypothetical protein